MPGITQPILGLSHSLLVSFTAATLLSGLICGSLLESFCFYVFFEKRVIKDHLLNVGGVTKISLTKEFLLGAKLARQRHQTYPDENER